MPKVATTPVPCDHCASLQQERPIGVPQELMAVILETRDYLAKGILEDCQHDGYPRSSFAVDVLPTGPWPDVVAADFRCTFCGRIFDLRAETYHGQGGFLEPTHGG